MASVPIKFRCFRCNQLLGVARTKVGTVVNCPKCSAGLIVPDPTESSESETIPTPGGETDGPTQSRSSTAPLGVDELLAEIRIEDIRVEPGVILESAPVASVADPETFPELREFSTPAPEPVAEPIPNLIPEETEAVVEVATTDDGVPPISFDPRKAPREYAPIARPRDVVLPRSVVLAWSLFVLLALSLAFVAGLLAGHFLWRVH